MIATVLCGAPRSTFDEMTGDDVASMLSDALEIVVLKRPRMIRELNEDSVFADTGRGLVILADGMGGYNAGEVASGMATRSCVAL